METSEKKMFFFKSKFMDGSPFELGRLGQTQSEAANSLASDLEKFTEELRTLGKSQTKPN
jgi:hypothetical protein